MPPARKAACAPLLKQITQMNQTIGVMDKQIDRLDKKYPEITVLRTAPGVGPVVAACYVLTLDSAQAMKTNRQAGAYLGLRPRQQKSRRFRPAVQDHQNGQHLPAQLIGAVSTVHPGPLWSRLGAAPLGAEAGCQWWQTPGKKRAIVAVARKLAVTLLSMWRNRKKFEPFPQTVAQLATA